MSRAASTDDKDESTMPLYPHERTFVVRFDRTTDFADGKCAGKLEAVATNSRHSFEDLTQLLGHLRRLVG
jgi:hypothetical protein